MNIQTVDEIRTLVRTERKKRGLSQTRAAALCGFSQKWLSGFECGHVNPPVDMVLTIMNIVGIKLQASVPAVLDSADDEAEAIL